MTESQDTQPEFKESHVTDNGEVATPESEIVQDEIKTDASTRPVTTSNSADPEADSARQQSDNVPVTSADPNSSTGKQVTWDPKTRDNKEASSEPITWSQVLQIPVFMLREKVKKVSQNATWRYWKWEREHGDLQQGSSRTGDPCSDVSTSSTSARRPVISSQSAFSHAIGADEAKVRSPLKSAMKLGIVNKNREAKNSAFSTSSTGPNGQGE